MLKAKNHMLKSVFSELEFEKNDGLGIVFYSTEIAEFLQGAPHLNVKYIADESFKVKSMFECDKCGTSKGIHLLDGIHYNMSKDKLIEALDKAASSQGLEDCLLTIKGYITEIKPLDRRFARTNYVVFLMTEISLGYFKS